jgi:hypothetical protein
VLGADSSVGNVDSQLPAHRSSASFNGMNIEGYWFKSSKFEIEPGEDEESSIP